MSRFLAKGGSVVRGTVLHIDQVLEAGSRPFLEDAKGTTPGPPDALIVCVGLAARSLGGVEDKSVFPSRGQTVILRAPWVKIGASFDNDDKQEWSYIIPRKNGDVVVGGTQGYHDWYARITRFCSRTVLINDRHPKPRPETTKDILRRGLIICPELVPPHLRRTDRPAEVADLSSIIVEEACGLRPMREGGSRIELEYKKTVEGVNIPVIHNYG